MMDAILEDRLKRLMLLRVVMVTTLLLVAIYVEAVSETLLRINPLYFLIVATYGLTILYVLALRLDPHLEGQVYVQVVLDLLIITGLVYFTGGTGNRASFMLLYPISVLSGSVLLRGKGLALAGLATVFYGGVLWAVRMGWIPEQGLWDIPAMPAKHLLYALFVTGVSCATVASIGSYLSHNLQAVGEKLEAAAVQVADLQELNKVIVDSIHSGLITADVAGKILYVNGFGESLLGLQGPAVLGRSLDEVFGPGPFTDIGELAREVERGLEHFDIRYERADGTAADLGMSVSPLAIGDGKDGGWLLAFQDLTDVRRLEDEVRTKEKLAAVGEMAAYLAHEIRNPLGAISGSAQVLMAEPKVSPEHERLLAIITRESKRLSDALEQFLFQARPTPRVMKPVDLGPVIAEAVTLLKNGPDVGPSHEVELKADDGPHVCLADRDQIVQVFWNLARNALAAMPEGGLLQIRLAARGDNLVLTVRDEGRGMGHEEQRRLFQPFQTRSRMGTGLGLAIVYRIVREHRGDIAVRSTPSQGTEVEVRLPLVPVAVAV
jgi:two-component system sensor histidine kinase PilS (NtrC family)